MRLLIVLMFFFGFSLAEARGIRSIANRLPQVIKRAEIGKFVAMGALGTMLICSPGCEHGDRMVDGGFTQSGTPYGAVTPHTYSASNLAYSLSSIIGNQRTGSVRETQHRGILLNLLYYQELQKVAVYLERHDQGKFKTYSKQIDMYPRGTGNSFDIYDSRTGGSDIGDGYAYDDGRTSYTVNAGDGVELTFLVSGHTSDGGRTIGRQGLYASKRVLDGQDLRGQPVYRNEKFSWLGLDAHHFLRIGPDAQLTRQ